MTYDIKVPTIKCSFCFQWYWCVGCKRMIISHLRIYGRGISPYPQHLSRLRIKRLHSTPSFSPSLLLFSLLSSPFSLLSFSSLFSLPDSPLIAHFSRHLSLKSHPSPSLFPFPSPSNSFHLSLTFFSLPDSLSSLLSHRPSLFLPFPLTPLSR